MTDNTVVRLQTLPQRAAQRRMSDFLNTIGHMQTDDHAEAFVTGLRDIVKDVRKAVKSRSKTRIKAEMARIDVRLAAMFDTWRRDTLASFGEGRE